MVVELEGNLVIKKISRKAYLTEAPKWIKSKVFPGPVVTSPMILTLPTHQ